MANIKVTVQWESPVIFAGEEVKCLITFKNDAPAFSRSRCTSPFVPTRNTESGRQRWKSELPKQQPFLAKRTRSLRKAEGAAWRPSGYQQALSVSDSTTRRALQAEKSHQGNQQIKGQKHGRSVSIVSIGSNTNPEQKSARNIAGPGTHDNARTHTRAASLQIVPNINSFNLALRPSPNPFRRPSDFTVQQPTYTPGQDNQSPLDSPTSNSNSPTKSFPRGTGGSGHFRGTSVHSPQNGAGYPAFHEPLSSRASSPRSPPTTLSGFHETAPPPGQEGRAWNKVLSPTDTNATPRSSLEIYSHSDHSTETLASEYMVPAAKQQGLRASYGSRAARLSPGGGHPVQIETLMMGYVQLTGAFVLDGSLINQSPFEPIKKKGVIGGQGGGGVVGVQGSRRDR